MKDYLSEGDLISVRQQGGGGRGWTASVRGTFISVCWQGMDCLNEGDPISVCQQNGE